MAAQIIQITSPEARELQKKKAELAHLEVRLAERELDLATLQAELHRFEGTYFRIVGSRLAEFDEVEAQIAEAEARNKPKDREAQERVAQARVQAQESAHAVEAEQQAGKREPFTPSEELKRLYREVAKRIHPDLATDESERKRRHELMTEANRAYEEGDAARLEAILRDWESSPESVKGEGPGAELVRVIRKIAQIEDRLKAIHAEVARLEESDLYHLKNQVDQAEEEGRDLLAEMAARVDEQVAEARGRLGSIRGHGASP
jgi:negative regulator of genetic competence, sporulation and motility